MAKNGIAALDIAALGKVALIDEGKSTYKTAPKKQRHGFTLLEVIISSAIMFTLIISLLSAWSATTDFSFMVNENLKRMEAAETIHSTIRADFKQSAQFVQYDSKVMVAVVNPKTSANVTLYPAILQGGREVQFVRFRTSIDVAPSPIDQNPYMENLTRENGQNLSEYALAPVSPYFIINPRGGLPGYWNLSPVWESNLNELTFDENANPQNLRIFRYILVPQSNVVPETLADGLTFGISSYPAYPEAGPTIRRGMLLRQFRNANSTTWQTVGLPLSDSIVFDTANNEYDRSVPCFIFASAYDGVPRMGSDSISDKEIRMFFSLAMQPKNASAPVIIDMRLSFPFSRIDFGE